MHETLIREIEKLLADLDRNNLSQEAIHMSMALELLKERDDKEHKHRDVCKPVNLPD